MIGIKSQGFMQRKCLLRLRLHSLISYPAASSLSSPSRLHPTISSSSSDDADDDVIVSSSSRSLKQYYCRQRLLDSSESMLSRGAVVSRSYHSISSSFPFSDKTRLTFHQHWIPSSAQYNRTTKKLNLTSIPKVQFEVTRAMASTAGDNNIKHTITLDNMNPNVKLMEYAVRGPLVIRATQIEREIREGKSDKPFKHVIRANIGDCHAMGQKPITFIRQVLACVSDPALIDSSSYPSDVKERARQLLAATGVGKSAGCYSDSAGVELIRRHCAEYIANRDGYPSSWEDIICTTGASEAVRAVLALVNSGVKDGIPSGVMIPIPQYPLYTATLAEYGMHPISYYLDEDNEWQLSIKELERALNESRSKCKPKALVVINPGNPTGAVLTKKNIEEIISFAQQNSLMIIADEVYQHNIYVEGVQFYSFKKIMCEMGEKLEMASLMSASKGYMGECGLRGGYAEVVNLKPDVKAMFLKMLSARLCSSVLGQMALDCIVNPPAPGSPSYDLHEKEKKGVLDSLLSRAKLAVKTFNSIPGMKSNAVAGAMYAFPQITLPDKAIQAAKEKGQAADFFYAWSLLEERGICIVPGSGFGQRPGTFHFRTTILPQPEELSKMMDELKDFHMEFTKKYS